VSATVADALFNVDTTSPTVTGLDPANGDSGSWASIDCATQAGRFCATIADTGGSTLTSPTYTLTRSSDSRCWSATQFVIGPCSGQPFSLISGSSYRTSAQFTWSASGTTNFLNGTYTLVITATDGAGNVTTSSTTFTVTGS
jgi:hypothetical protein